MKVRAIIADDEMLARERLQQLLSKEPDIDVIGECADGVEAVNQIQEKKPDLVFLDVQMPELDGFGVLASLNKEAMPVIVFVTAHDKFALRAFEVHAVDYLLKPFDRERFQTALTRALERIKQRGDKSQGERQAAVLAELKGPSKPLERLAIKSDGRVLFVRLEDINWIEAAHNYVEVHDEKQGHLVRDTVQGIEAKLPPEKFVRISRSVIVNISKIKEMQPLFYGEYTVTLHSGKKLTLSRRYRKKLPALGLG
jgi:two-component system LytT family response regulator